MAIWIAGLVTFAGAGVWLALITDVALMWSSAAVVGAALGTLVVAGYLHVLEKDAGRPPAAPNR